MVGNAAFTTENTFYLLTQHPLDELRIYRLNHVKD